MDLTRFRELLTKVSEELDYQVVRAEALSRLAMYSCGNDGNRKRLERALELV